jgi:hypothetical protein
MRLRLLLPSLLTILKATTKAKMMPVLTTNRRGLFRYLGMTHLDEELEKVGTLERRQVANTSVNSLDGAAASACLFEALCRRQLLQSQRRHSTLDAVVSCRQRKSNLRPMPGLESWGLGGLELGCLQAARACVLSRHYLATTASSIAKSWVPMPHHPRYEYLGEAHAPTFADLVWSCSLATCCDSFHGVGNFLDKLL